MEKPFSEEQLNNLAAQLRCPEGEMGIATGLNMNTGNQAMISATLELLQLPANASVLELGPGNAQHLPSLLEQYSISNYQGLEISQTMCDQAAAMHKDAAHSKVRFSCYDGIHIPFEKEMFDGIFTINTIYFWEQPQVLLSEMERVLKPGGQLFITFAQASFMQQLPFVQYGFTLYDTEKIAALLTPANFSIAEEWHKNDVAISKIGTKVDRAFTVLKLKKSGL